MNQAVEFLEDKLNQIKSSSTDMNGTIKFLETEFKELFQQAKEMEEEQIMQALNDGKAMAINSEKNKSLEQYYNKTFKSK